MANLKGTQAANASFFPVPSAEGQAEEIVIFGDLTLAAGGASGDIIEMLPWPRNMTLVDLIADCEGLAGTTWTADVGIMSGNWGDSGTRTMGAEIMTGKAFAGAGIFRADVAGFSRLASAANDRSIGVKGTTITGPTTGKKLRLTARFRPLVEGV